MANQVTKMIIVKADPGTTFDVWANFANFPKFMHYIKSVTSEGDGTSHWVMEGPFGFRVSWDAETTLVEPGRRIAWNSKRKSPLITSGQVTFTPLDKGETQLTVTMHYEPPAGWPGEVVAQVFGDPEKKLEADLHNFKNYIEGQVHEVNQEQ